jgi:hypothetical protein
VNRRLLFLLVPALLWAACAPVLAEDEIPNVTGTWQISWEARIGTQQGVIQFQQTGSALTGTFKGGPGSPAVSGQVRGRDISFTLQFPGSRPFAIDFSGAVTGDAMAGKFNLHGIQDGYDWHGENARPTNYSWTAKRENKLDQPAQNAAAPFTHPNPAGAPR